MIALCPTTESAACLRDVQYAMLGWYCSLCFPLPAGLSHWLTVQSHRHVQASSLTIASPCCLFVGSCVTHCCALVGLTLFASLLSTLHFVSCRHSTLSLTDTRPLRRTLGNAAHNFSFEKTWICDIGASGKTWTSEISSRPAVATRVVPTATFIGYFGSWFTPVALETSLWPSLLAQPPSALQTSPPTAPAATSNAPPLLSPLCRDQQLP